ncbi:MAG: hypothetical protein ABI868_18970 [Acidobacteriota bacterium]
MGPTSDPPGAGTPPVRAALNRRRLVLFLATLALLLATFAWQFGRDPGRPSSPRSLQAYQIPLTPGSEIAQTLIIPWHDFARVRVHVVVEGRVSGGVQVAIDRLGQRDDVVMERDLRQAQATVRELAGEADLDVTFPPIRDSAGQRYRLRAVAPVVLGGRLALAANRENTYPLGSLYVGGKRAAGDLVFDAYSSLTTRADLLRAAIAGRPWPFSSPVTFWGLITLFCVTASGLVVLAAEVSGALPRPADISGNHQ